MVRIIGDGKITDDLTVDNPSGIVLFWEISLVERILSKIINIPGYGRLLRFSETSQSIRGGAPEEN